MAESLRAPRRQVGGEIPAAGPGLSVRPDLAPLELEALLERTGREPRHLVAILLAVQKRCGYLPEAVLLRLTELTSITPADIEGVSTFYAGFRRTPAGRHTIRVCVGTACFVKGAENIVGAFRQTLGIREDSDTDPQGLFTVERVACLGCCTLAPVVQIDGAIYGSLTRRKVPAVLKDFLAGGAGGEEDTTPGAAGAAGTVGGRGRGTVALCTCSSCRAAGALEVFRAFRQEVRSFSLPVEVRRSGCSGLSYRTPLAEILLPDGGRIHYAGITPGDVREILLRHFPTSRLGAALRRGAAHLLDRLLEEANGEGVERLSLDLARGPDGAFWAPQLRIVTALGQGADPLDLERYRAEGGFAALERCLRGLSPRQVVAIVRASSLRGRGGGGYLTGAKWQEVRSAPGQVRYVVCNADEGDPGAFMNRMTLESFPFRVIEGLAIAAYAVGARHGLFFVRSEYPLAIRRLRQALELCAAAGILRAGGQAGPGPAEAFCGRDGARPGSSPDTAAADRAGVDGSTDPINPGFALSLEVVESAGAFVCGEETALIAALEGRRGNPRARPPYPSARGLWGQPTLVNNVETLATVPWILTHGVEAFKAAGTPASPGTKTFALAGKIVRGGLIEVPMGISIRRIVEEIGGGIEGGRHLKAVQIGGPSGGCIPETLADLPVDFDSLSAAGAMMGSGGLVVLDDSDCMVDVARYFMSFTAAESCGKCTSCRVGTRRLLELLTRLCSGRGRAGDLERLEELALGLREASLCGLGRTAPNPVLSTLRYFREEYEAHLAGRCPAGRCRELIAYSISERCIGCTRCAQACPAGAIAPRPYERHLVDPSLCIRCDSCRQVCPAEAVEVVSRKDLETHADRKADQEAGRKAGGGANLGAGQGTGHA